MLRRLPVSRLSRQMTSCPSARNRSQRCEPTNPAPPVMTVLKEASRVGPDPRRGHVPHRPEYDNGRRSRLTTGPEMLRIRAPSSDGAAVGLGRRRMLTLANIRRQNDGSAGGAGFHWPSAEGTCRRGQAHPLELEHHHVGGHAVVAVDDEPRPPQVRARLEGEPADDRHAAVVAGDVDVLLAAEVVVEVDLVPGLGEPGDALGGGRDPDGVGVDGEELLGPGRVVVQEEPADGGGLARGRLGRGERPRHALAATAVESASAFHFASASGRGYSMIGRSRLRQLEQAEIAAGDPLLLVRDEVGVERRLVEEPPRDDRLEALGHDELGQDRVATDVPLGRQMQGFRGDLAQDVPQVEVGFGQVGDVAAADVAEIALLADGHGGHLLVSAPSYRMGASCNQPHMGGGVAGWPQITQGCPASNTAGAAGRRATSRRRGPRGRTRRGSGRGATVRDIRPSGRRRRCARPGCRPCAGHAGRSRLAAARRRVPSGHACICRCRSRERRSRPAAGPCRWGRPS